MTKEMIDVELDLGETGIKLKKMTKAELLNTLLVTVLRSRCQDETIASLEGIEQNLAQQLEEGIELRKKIVSELKAEHEQEIRILESRNDKSESYVSQARSMIEAAMERWDDYSDD